MTSAMPLAGLRMFEAAARTGSFRLAAGDIGISPSAISHAVRKLERDLGTTLFARDGRNVTLTADGRTLMDHVGRGFAELRDGLAAVTASPPGLLLLHSAPSFAAQWLAPRLPRFLVAHPEIEVRLASGTDYRRFDRFDADIVYGEPSGDTGAISLGPEIVAPLCTAQLARQIQTPSDLLGLTMIESDNKRVRWTNWFQANGLVAPPPRGPHFDRSFLAIAAAADGVGVALESLRLAEREILSGRLVTPVWGQSHNVTYNAHWLIAPLAHSRRRALSSFTQWLLRELGLPP